MTLGDSMEPWADPGGPVTSSATDSTREDVGTHRDPPQVLTSSRLDRGLAAPPPGSPPLPKGGRRLLDRLSRAPRPLVALSAAPVRPMAPGWGAGDPRGGIETIRIAAGDAVGGYLAMAESAGSAKTPSNSEGKSNYE